MKRGIVLASAWLIGASAPDDFSRTVDALAAGVSSQGQAMRTRAAGQALLATGARPLEGDDLAKRWAGNGAPRYRDRALGPGYRTVAVTAGGTAHFEQTFLAGQRAQIAIVPLNHALFALSVKDDQGSVSCAAPPSGRCAWVPLWTARYAIDVVNPGRTTGHYLMVVQ